MLAEIGALAFCRVECEIPKVLCSPRSDDPVRKLGRGVCQCVRQCVGLCPMQMEAFLFWLATKQQAPSCACDPCVRQDPLRLPTATSLGAASSSKCYRSQSGQTIARICSTPTKTERGNYEILHSCTPLYDPSAKPNTRNRPPFPLTQCLLLRAATAAGSPTSTSVCTLRPSFDLDAGGTGRQKLHITRAITADSGTVKMGALMGGSTCPFTLLAPSFLCSSRPAHS